MGGSWVGGEMERWRKTRGGGGCCGCDGDGEAWMAVVARPWCCPHRLAAFESFA